MASDKQVRQGGMAYGVSSQSLLDLTSPRMTTDVIRSGTLMPELKGMGLLCWLMQAAHLLLLRHLP